MRLRRWLAEPLLHFLAAGALIFMLAGWMGSRGANDRTIRLTRNDLLDFAQSQTQVYAAPAFDRMFETMPGEQRRRLIHNATLQEALYREGQAIALDRADPLIRQRIVQQMRFLVADEAAAGVTVDDGAVGEYFRAHGEDYRVPATVSFTHVFFSAAEHGAAAEGLARDELQRLRAARVPFERAARHGERFLYQTNYIDSDPGLIASHFGAELAQQLFAARPSPQWQGPFRSDYGWHLVLLRQRSDARLQPLEEVRGRVRDDALAAKRARLVDMALDRVLASYRVELGPGVEP